MDCGYYDHRLFDRWTREDVGFDTRLKKNAMWASHDQRPVKPGGKVRRDVIGRFHDFDASRRKETEIQRVTVWIEENGEEMELLTNHFDLSAETIVEIYKQRWRIELFFKAIKRQAALGFGAMSGDQADFEGMKEKILEESKSCFKPEFLNRLDDLVVFHMLEKVDLNKIVDLEVSKLVKRLAEKEITLTLTQEARDFLSEKGFDPAYGARPMRRAVERFLEDPLAEALLRGDVKPADTVNVVKKSDSDELAFASSRPEPQEEASV